MPRRRPGRRNGAESAQDDRRGGRRRRHGAVICVAEGTYAEQLKPGEKYFTLAGGFQRGKDFKVRDSAAYVTKATGRGGSFIRIEDPGAQGQPAHRDRRLRDQRLLAGDLSRLLRVAAVRHHQQPHPRQQMRRQSARRRRRLLSTTSRAGSKATSSGTIPAAAAAPASLNDTTKKNASRSSATSSTAIRHRAGRLPRRRRLCVRQDAHGSPETCSRATP